MLKSYGLKLISYNENNVKNNLPKINATSLIFDANNGLPLALLNARDITAYRTGTASAIGVKYLANESAKKLLIIGTGSVAIHSLAAILLVKPNLESVYVCNTRHKVNEEQREEFIRKVDSLLSACNIERKILIEFTTDIEMATKECDIIVTATPSEVALIKNSWLKSGVHFSCMGTCMKGHQEIEETIFSNARVFADDVKQCLETGEIQTAYQKKLVNGFTGEIGDVINGNTNGRLSEKDITIFDSTGLFIQDLALSLKLLEKAEENNIGTLIEI